MSNNIFPLKVEEGMYSKNNVLRKKIARTVSTQSLEIVAVTFKKNSKVFFDNSAQIVGFFSGRTEMPSSGSGRTSRSIERTTTTSKDSFPRNQSPIKSFVNWPPDYWSPDNLSLIVLRWQLVPLTILSCLVTDGARAVLIGRDCHAGKLRIPSKRVAT